MSSNPDAAICTHERVAVDPMGGEWCQDCGAEMTEIPVALAHAFRDLAQAAKGVRHARKTYLGVANSEVYYERLFAALDAVEEARRG